MSDKAAISAAERSWGDHSGPLIDTVKGFEVVDCRNCGFKHVLPIPSREDLETTYREDYYYVEKPLYLEHLREDFPWWVQVHGERFDAFERLLPIARRRILDIGAGSGHFLKVGLDRGWTCVGVEPSRQAAAHARSLGVNVFEDFLSEDNVDQLGTFDVVHLHEVLEHIPDPIGMLQMARRLVTPGGLICAITPNDYNPLQVLLRDHVGFAPWWVAPPHHLNYFDLPTLAWAIERAGFEVVERTATFPIEFFLLMGDNYVGNDPLGREVHGKRKRLEHALVAGGLGELKQEMYKSLADLGLGREAVVIARAAVGPAERL